MGCGCKGKPRVVVKPKTNVAPKTAAITKK
jgi:hypothetical protein